MTYNFDDYINTVKNSIKNKKLHAPICAELESHLQDSADFYVEIGYDEETANRKALEDMGEPTTVGESMAKLHKLSGWQRGLMLLFCSFAVLKIIDLLLGLWIDYNIFVFEEFVPHWLFGGTGSFYFFSDFLVLIFTVAVGVALALYTKRSTPVWMSVVMTVLGIRQIWVFSYISYVSVCGRLDEYLKVIREFNGVDPFGFSEYVVPIIIATVIVSALIFCYVCAIKYVDKVFYDIRKTKKIAMVVMWVLFIASVSIYTSVCLYIDKREKVQFEVYSRTVSDICDLCLENGTMTADDFNMIKEKFSYLDFKEVDPESINNYTTNCDTVLFAETGESTTVASGLYLGKSVRGALYLGVQVSGEGFDLIPAPFYILNVLTYDTRWEASPDAVDSMIEMFGTGLEDGTLVKGDSLEGYLNKVKETSSRIRYEYYEYPDNPSEFGEEYASELIESGIFGFDGFYIYADDGKFSYSTVTLD